MERKNNVSRETFLDIKKTLGRKTMNKRILIAGGIMHGKTTLAKKLAKELGLPHFCTDSKKDTRHIEDGITYAPDDLQWKEYSAYALTNWLITPEAKIVEGIAAIRALRKWYEHPELHPNQNEAPIDRLIIITTPAPKATFTPEQNRTNKGHDTILAKTLPLLPDSIEIEYVDHRRTLIFARIKELL